MRHTELLFLCLRIGGVTLCLCRQLLLEEKIIMKSQTPAEATEKRDALAKALYGGLFASQVTRFAALPPQL